jgi:hypothetical protein
MERHAQYPWILIGPNHALCEVCQVTCSKSNLKHFINAHRGHQAPGTHYPIGDAVARIAKALGARKPCAGCEKRRYQWNRLVHK